MHGLSIAFRRETTYIRSFIPICLVICLLIQLVVPANAQSTSDLVSLATSVINPLKAMDSLVLGGIGEAISKGNDDLRDRLEQLHGIIQEALATADQILKSRIDQLDNAAKNRIAQSLRGTMELANKFSADYQQGIRQADAALEQRILQFQQQVGNIVAALPINFDPIINVDPAKGLTTVRGRGDYTTLFLSGVGLFKDGTKPQAFLLLKPNPSTPEWLEYRTGIAQDAIRTVDVSANSMGLIVLRIKNSDIPYGNPPVPLTLEVHLRRGGTLIADIVKPTFPLRVCDPLPHYRAILNVKATGERWDRREVPVPGATTVGGHFPNGFYIESCGRNDCNAHLDICAVPSEGFEVDDDPVAGYQGGLRWGPDKGGDRYRAITDGVPHAGCVRIYADGREGPSNVWIAEVSERQRRKLDASPCTEHGASSSLDLIYGEWRQQEFNLKDAVVPCGDSGLSKTPELTYRLRVEDDSRSPVWITDLTPSAPARSEDGRFEAKVSSSGLLTATAMPSCRWNFDGALAK